MYIPQFNPRVRKNKKTRQFLFEIRDNEGKTVEHQSGFKTKREAENAALEVQQKLRQGYTLDRYTSLYDWYQTWYDLKIRPKNKLSKVTKKNYQTYGKTIKKLFGDRAIVDIKSTEYQRIMNIYGETVGYDYLSRINSTIRKTIQLAQSDKIVLDDFISNVELFAGKEAQKNEEKYIHSVEDYHRLVNYLEKKLDYETTVIYHVLYIIAKTGMRYGEAIGITDNDLKLEDHYLYTHRRYNTTTWGWTKAKNDTSIRAVPIDNKTIEIITELRKEQIRVNAILERTNKEKFLFFHYGLEHDIPSVATANKTLKNILNELNIQPVITTKGLRHTYGSYLLYNNVDMGVVAKILGHKDIQMLIKVYGHTMTERIDKEFKEVESIMDRL
ncbi:site-specific integrase [Streptococcus mutans]|uniref:tyrosine-type recombinase/integrase n=1 Tax=Streptococcus mutans TaxID=1309 RepID=UPI001CFC8921|nr:site-specific integrase [Streptococcus mutans]MCB4975962.1 site-specific integrase [Streptococcus mutans]MCB4998457.1 site-specific integrase [Streptococcus mutans]MCB5018588.1 site-specific integrase [Streptococcus mutans]MCB5021187.1 site-specific integrase [Streptococcus mutans]MCB5083428.1 site-specific integrase [Streptococcus mutans]